MASKQRTPEQIRADIAASRHAMTSGIEGLVSEVHPTVVKQRVIDEARQVIDDTKRVVAETIVDTVEETRSRVKDFLFDNNGVRWNNIGTVAMVVVGVTAAYASLGKLGSLFRGIGR